MYQFKVGDILVVEGEGIDYKVIDVSPEGCKVSFRSVTGDDYTFLCKWGVYPLVLKQNKDKYYGTINFTKLEARLKHLSEGGKLLMKDGEYNSYLFHIDPTTSVILSNYLKGTFSIINEGEYLLMGYGDWYIYEEPTNQSCTHCLGKGTIPISKALIPI